MHLGDILDIMSDECGELEFGKVMRMARNIMELHSTKVNESNSEGYESGYNSGLEVGKSLVQTPTPDELEVKKLRQVYNYQHGRAQELVKDIVARIGSDRKVQCIKELRKETGLGLKDSKDIVDDYCRKLEAMELVNEERANYDAAYQPF